MSMRFLAKIRKNLGIDSMYEMAQRLKMLNNSYIYLEKKSKGCDMTTLSDIRKLSGLSWNDFGLLIDKEAEENRKAKQ
jgi:hypothetical protein